ncbi:uncharacterized protein, partial [Temnothorax longispinosus]|uniref:uncharacterized protein n=1 Tax=Temnothorax longispinosus TaxID=300112 RepID=UPI003A99EE27
QPQNAKLCSLHFEESAFDRRADYYIKIRPGAIPFENASVCNVKPSRKKLKIHHTNEEAIIDPKTTKEIFDSAIPFGNASVSNVEPPRKKLKVHHTIEEAIIDPKTKEIFDTYTQIDCHSDIFATATTENTVISTSCTYQGIDVVPQINTPPEVKHQGTAVSPHLSEDTPRKQILRAALTNTRKDLNKKIKSLQPKYRRSMKRIANLKNVLAALKKKRLLDPHQLDILNDLGTFNKQLLMRQDNKIHKTRMRKQYEPELRSFALTLHFYSPQAYAFVRKKFNTCLPHPKTIYEWYKSINDELGFNEEALQSIKQRAELVNYSLFGVLIFDEMVIRRHVEYDGKNFTKLHEIQINKRLHLANKLRTQHVNYHKQKIKLKLAAQVFSASSVADAIDFCKNELKYTDFADSAATTRFIRLRNDIFDILNSRNMKQRGFKQPLHENNSSIIINKLNEGYNYLSQLRTTKNGLLLCQSKKKMWSYWFYDVYKKSTSNLQQFSCYPLGKYTLNNFKVLKSNLKNSRVYLINF